jgi:hypothetical protein
VTVFMVALGGKIMTSLSLAPRWEKGAESGRKLIPNLYQAEWWRGSYLGGAQVTMQWRLLQYQVGSLIVHHLETPHAMCPCQSLYLPRTQAGPSGSQLHHHLSLPGPRFWVWDKSHTPSMGETLKPSAGRWFRGCILRGCSWQGGRALPILLYPEPPPSSLGFLRLPWG